MNAQTDRELLVGAILDLTPDKWSEYAFANIDEIAGTSLEGILVAIITSFSDAAVDARGQYLQGVIMLADDTMKKILDHFGTNPLAV